MKVFIISQPKSGTYLLSALISFFNLKESYLHFSENKYEKYDHSKLEKGRTEPSFFSQKLSIVESIKLVPENSIAVGHLPYTQNIAKLLINFKKVFIDRNIQDRLQSAVRWSKFSGRSVPKVSKSKIDLWKTDKNIFVIQFEDIKNKKISAIDKLQLFLFNEVKYNSIDAVDYALNTETLTKVKIQNES